MFFLFHIKFSCSPAVIDMETKTSNGNWQLGNAWTELGLQQSIHNGWNQKSQLATPSLRLDNLFCCVGFHGWPPVGVASASKDFNYYK